MQNFMQDLLGGCHRAGLAVPMGNHVPEDLVVWHNSTEDFPGDTVAAACKAAERCFQAKPDIIFAILPERGTCFFPTQ